MSEESSLNDRVAEEIRVLLVRRRSSASELARQAGMSQPYISRRLTGAATFDLDDLEKLATALDVQVADLLPAPARRGEPPTGPIRTAYPDSPERSAPHAPDVRSRPDRGHRSSDAGSKSKRAFWTHA